MKIFKNPYKHFLLLVLVAFFACTKKHENTNCESATTILKMFCTSDKGPTLNSNNGKMNALEFWQQQECVIKTSYQNYNMPLSINEVVVPVQLIGCACNNEIKDIFPKQTIVVEIHNNNFVYEGDSSIVSFSDLSKKCWELFNCKKNFEGTRDYLFVLIPDCEVKMKTVNSVIEAYYIAYAQYIYRKYIKDQCFSCWSEEQKKMALHNNRPMITLHPKGISNYCMHCGCADSLIAN